MNEPVRETIPLSQGAVSCLSWKGDGPVLHFAHANGFNAETYRTLLSPLTDRPCAISACASPMRISR